MTNSSGSPVIWSPEEATPEALTAVFREGGFLTNARIVGVDYNAIGDGMLGDTFRFEVRYDNDPGEAPRSFIGKFAPKDAQAKANGAALGIFDREVGFYRRIAPKCSVRAPKAYFAAVSADKLECALLLEDATPARQADQLSGCSRAEAELAMRQAAALAAPWFGDFSLYEDPWFHARRAALEPISDQFSDLVELFRVNFADTVSAEHMRVAEELARCEREFTLKVPKRTALVHGDFRLDNLLFDGSGGRTPILVLDWQTVFPDNPALDIAYFVASSYPIEMARRDERELVDCFHEEIGRLGVRDYSKEDLWTDYRRSGYLSLWIAIVASAQAKKSERGDAVFARLAAGGAEHILAHDSFSLA